MARIVELVGWAFFAGFVLLIALVFLAVTWGAEGGVLRGRQVCSHERAGDDRPQGAHRRAPRVGLHVLFLRAAPARLEQVESSQFIRLTYTDTAD